jgi:hypothetical protein
MTAPSRHAGPDPASRSFERVRARSRIGALRDDTNGALRNDNPLTSSWRAPSQDPGLCDPFFAVFAPNQERRTKLLAPQRRTALSRVPIFRGMTRGNMSGGLTRKCAFSQEDTMVSRSVAFCYHISTNEKRGESYYRAYRNG